MEAAFLTFVFVLSIFLGFELISKVPSSLHTPLMSGSNAISGITLIGAIASVRAGNDGRHRSRRPGGRPCRGQRGGRLRGNQQNAQDVQEER